MDTTTEDSLSCSSIMPWWLTYAISLAIFVFGLFLIGIKNLINKSKCHFKPDSKMKKSLRKQKILIKPVFGEVNLNFDELMEDNSRITYCIDFVIWCERMTSQRLLIGRITCLFLVIFNILSWAIYIAFTYHQTSINYLEGDCYSDNMIIPKWIDFGLNSFFTFHFILRAFAAIDFIKFWFLPATLLDICTIPNVFISTFLPVRRQGMSFIRIFYIRHLYEVIFVNFGLRRITSKTKIFNLGLYLISVWLIGSGFMHMVENTGDFWSANTYKQYWTFWECTYFMLVTISTIGYGDYNPKSVSSQVIVCIYIIYAITLFATALPEIINAINESKYNDKYISRNGEKHMIVTGQFNNSSIKGFLKVFTKKRKRRNFRNIKFIIMHSQPCDHILSLHLKKYSSTIMYLVGSLQNNADMERANLHKSVMIFILSLPFTDKINDDDSENIMTAISLKAQNEHIRTIVQLHLYSNKILLKMFPRWNKYNNDIVVCLDELRLGLMAYNCLAQGMAALITNLMIFTEPMKTEIAWRKEYEEGARSRLYSVEFSDDFHGLSSLEVALTIYKLWDVCLLAIKYANGEEMNTIIINPMSRNINIDATSMIGIVMARDEINVHRIQFYCAKCHNDEPLKVCDCLTNSPNKNKYIKKLSCVTKIKKLNKSSTSSFLPSLTDDKSVLMENIEEKIDETETFHWSSSPKLDDISINVKQAQKRNFSDHILLCLCGSGSGTIDLCNFMMPLRFRFLTGDKLRPVVILGNEKYFEDHKWNNIKNFPMLIIINGSPIQARDLRAAGLFECYACAIINGNDSESESSDKRTLICATLIKSMINDHQNDFPMITEIREDEVACHFSSIEAFDLDKTIPVQHSEPYAGGHLFTNSILHKCIYSIYYNPDTFSFITTLINGSRSEIIEKMFGCGVGLLPKTSVNMENLPSDTMFQLVSITDPLFNEAPSLHEDRLTYEELFEWILKTKQVLCLGLYRLHFGKNRYVYTHPHKSTKIIMTDKIYCSSIKSSS